MWITNQSKDIKVLLDDESIEDLHVEAKFYEGLYFGENIVFENIILGTYDNIADADQIYKEIHRLFKNGTKTYSMPEASLDMDELEDLFEKED